MIFSIYIETEFLSEKTLEQSCNGNVLSPSSEALQNLLDYPDLHNEIFKTVSSFDRFKSAAQLCDIFLFFFFPFYCFSFHVVGLNQTCFDFKSMRKKVVTQNGKKIACHKNEYVWRRWCDFLYKEWVVGQLLSIQKTIHRNFMIKSKQIIICFFHNILVILKKYNNISISRQIYLKHKQ